MFEREGNKEKGRERDPIDHRAVNPLMFQIEYLPKIFDRMTQKEVIICTLNDITITYVIAFD